MLLVVVLVVTLELIQGDLFIQWRYISQLRKSPAVGLAGGGVGAVNPFFAGSRVRVVKFLVLSVPLSGFIGWVSDTDVSHQCPTVIGGGGGADARIQRG